MEMPLLLMATPAAALPLTLPSRHPSKRQTHCPPLLLLRIIFLFLLPLSTSTSSSSLSLSSTCSRRSSNSQIHNNTESARCTATAVFAFGDSTADSGNNNFLPTAFRANFPPYGRDFFDHTPTGRFSNGKLTADFVDLSFVLYGILGGGFFQTVVHISITYASYFGLKDHLPPYLDLTLEPEELLTGVSFASAGSGYDLLTSQFSGIIPVLLQIGLFRTYQARLLLMIGKAKTDELIREAIFLVSAGTNDFVTNYFPLPVRKKDFNVQQYETFIVQKIVDFLQDLMDIGAKRIVVAGLPPMGCLPVVITLNWIGRFQERGCIKYYNNLAREFNAKLQVELERSFRYTNARIAYADIYNPVIDVISAPSKYGFKETMSGCCGTGLVEVSYLCNQKSPVCPNASKYVFWDSIHPTEKMYRIVFNALRPSFDAIC